MNIAVSIYRTLSLQKITNRSDNIQQVVLISADTDMTPALKAVREDFPEVTIGIILPHRQGIERVIPGSLANNCHWVRRTVSAEELSAHQFPDKVPTHKKPAIKPDYW